MVKIVDYDNVNATRLRVSVAVALGICGVASVGQGLVTYTYMDFNDYGGFYAGFMAVFTSVFFCIRLENYPINRLYIAVVMTVLLSFIASIIDGLGYTLLDSFKACTNKYSGSVGDDDYYTGSESCQLSFSADCTCVNQKLSQNPTCYLYSSKDIAGTETDSCSPILDTYPDKVMYCFIIDLLLAILSVALTVVLSNSTKHVYEEDVERVGRSTIRSPSIASGSPLHKLNDL